MTIWAFNKADEPGRKLVYESVKAGKSRFGWSWYDKHNLKLEANQAEWQKLKEVKEWEAETGKSYWSEWRARQQPLLEVQPEDWIVHISTPKYGRCIAAQVTSAYDFDEGLQMPGGGQDFRHCFNVDPESVIEFDRNDAMVPPALSARLKLMGRLWKIYVEKEFNVLLESLHKGTEPTPKTLETNLRFLSDRMKPHLEEISQKIQHTHPNFDLESLIMKVFERVPGVRAVEQKRGRADRGADLLVELEFGSIPGLLRTLVVQIKSFEGEIDDNSAIEQIKNALDEYENASMGLIVSTATSASKQFRDALDKLKEENQDKPIALLTGADLAAFVLQFGGDLLR